MPKFLYASPILPGKSELVRQIFRRQNESGTSPWDQGLAEAVGLYGCQAWLQRTPQRDYFVQCLETANFMELFTQFQNQVELRNPHALWLRDFYLTTLGKDFGHHSAAPHTSCSLTMDLPTPGQRKTYIEGFALPLQTNKLSAYLEFCRQATGEFLYRFQEAYQRFGATHISYFLQRTAAQNLLLIYQESLQMPAEQKMSQRRDIRDQSPACQWLTNSLTHLTGLPFDALQPSSEMLMQGLRRSEAKTG